MRAAYFTRILAFVSVFFWLTPAFAWIETQVRGHSARIELSEDGSATVRHELQLKVRGGPMKTLEISGVGTDIEPLPDAHVRRAAQGSAGRWPVQVSSMEDGAVRLGISSERGLRGGNYVFSFAYQMKLSEGKGLSIEDERAVVSWVGPRLSSGVDSARVTFVVPRGENTPQLAPAADGPSANVLLGEVRRGTEFDEVDLIRAHLATGEPAVWRISVDPSVFLELGSQERTEQQSEAIGYDRSSSVAQTFNLALPPGRYPWLIGLSLFYAALVFFKARSVARLGIECDARLLPLIPLPAPLRALFSGALVAALIWAVYLQRLFWALSFLGAALIVVTHLLPVRRVRPRGPGKWFALPASVSENLPRLSGGWFDTHSIAGCSLLLILLGALLACSFRVLPSSNYLALMTLSGVPLLLPLFFTGNRRDFPQTPLKQALPWQRYLAKAIDPRLASIQLWGRLPALEGAVSGESAAESQASKCDEMRVRILVENPPHGLRAMELVFEERAGAHVQPCVLLRVLEDSLALARLPKDVSWQRGRTPEERVAMLRPTAPTQAQTARLIRLLLKALTTAQSPSSSNARKSSGKSQLTGARPAVGMAM